MISKDNIVALATASGVAAIAVIRISGPDAITICDSFFSLQRHSTLSEQPPHTIHLGHIKSNTQIIDEVLVSVFKAPQSYTGENVIEISCHGSLFIQQQIINLCLAHGCRLANPGEFTLRAFLNGKLDLSQAEAVADLIASESKAEHKIALQQMRGGFSSDIKQLRDQLIHFAALIELELDFSEEDVEFANRDDLRTLIENIKILIEDLIRSFAYGNAIKDGVAVTIVGKPNAGKSSLLNALLNEERAIVSHIAGTTRDTIEDSLTIDGIKFRFIDTAGLRHTKDTIEAIGVERTKAKIETADIVILVYEYHNVFDDALIEELKKTKAQLVLALNKIDLYQDVYKVWQDEVKQRYPEAIHLSISVKEGTHLERLKKHLVSYIKSKKTNDTIVTNSRHLEVLQHALSSIQEITKGLENQLSGDLLAIDIREALQYLGQITGVVDVDRDILGTIFGKFCIGK